MDAVLSAIFDRLSPVAQAAESAEIQAMGPRKFVPRHDLWAREGSYSAIFFLCHFMLFVVFHSLSDDLPCQSCLKAKRSGFSAFVTTTLRKRCWRMFICR